MDCNREEAIRAKEMAEDLMKKTDFNGARRLALRAQKLYSELENISQMLMVCDVHCAAGVNVFGNEIDWYRILQIEQIASDVTIKKQYRKFALLLHPDKNKFPGAEAAFKLIGEAQRTLLDRDKRSLHDMKCKASVSRPAQAPLYRPQEVPNYYTSTSVQNHNVRNNFFTGRRPDNQCPQQQAPRPQMAVPRDRLTFWTSCPFCSTRYEYYREIINRFINCQKCGKQFTAYEVSAQGAAPATNSSQAAFPFTQKRKVPDQNVYNVERRYHERSGTDNSRKQSFPATGYAAKFGSEKVGTNNVSTEKVGTKKFATEKVGEKRKRKKIVDSSESSESERSSESEEDIAVAENGEIKAGQDFGSFVGQQPRRSGRSKRQVSYNENLSDDDGCAGNHPERSMENGKAKQEEASESGNRSDADNISEETLPNGSRGSDKIYRKGKDEVGVSTINSEACSDVKKNREVHSLETDSSSELEAGPKIYECPDPDFNDFDKLREEGCFKAGQTWAIYDSADGMPRFYAQINKVFTPGFKLRITWLEPDPDDQNEIKWHEEELPVSCGRYTLGSSANTEDHLMFSHLIQCEKGSRRDPYKIFPRKGESWALFKNWDIEWFSDPDSHRSFEYEFVEVVSDYAEGEGISVAYLHKVNGFTSVFCRVVKEGTDTFQIPARELFRFSHRVPSFKLTGKERKDAPKGFFELDPASLPPEPMDSSDELKPMSKTENCGSPGLNLDPIEIPEAEFYRFDADKSEKKFQIGQIWSLYSDEEGLPKYYAQIQKIEYKPEFKLHISWLEHCLLPENVIQWRDKEMPICCGTFKVKKGGSEPYSGLNTFSHELRVEATVKRNEYLIYPKNGDVWALYRNWSNEIKYSDLGKCEYDVVEVVDKNDADVEVLVLERVGGFNSVFKVAMKDGSLAKMLIPGEELLRFSHQIPAFRLTDERGGSLRGFLELDLAALPLNYSVL